MAKFLVRRFFSLLLTMVLISLAVFSAMELAPGDIVRNMLGIWATPEQEASLRAQLGLNRPAWERYVSWLVGSDLLFAQPTVGMPLRTTTAERTGNIMWWAEEPDGTYVQWRLEGDDLIAIRLNADQTTTESIDNGRWKVDAEAEHERLATYRESLYGNSELLYKDRERIGELVDQLMEVLGQPGQAQTDLMNAIQQPEAELAALDDEGEEEDVKTFQTAADALINHDLFRVLALAITYAEDPDAYKVQVQASTPNMLGQVATKMTKSRPELAGQLREASQALLADDVDGAGEILGGTIPIISEMTEYLTLLAAALDNHAYQEAAGILEALQESKTAGKPAVASFIAGQFREASSAIKTSLPEPSEALSEAADSLDAGDIGAAEDALGVVSTVLRERGPVMARHQAIKTAKVGRYFWGVDSDGHAVLWKTRNDQSLWLRMRGTGSWLEQESGPVAYIPLQGGLVRGDPGKSMRTRQPVGQDLSLRLRNSLILAGLALVVIVPLALCLGFLAGINEGKPVDRVLSLFGLITTSSPEFATGSFLALIFGVWLKVLPPVTVYTSETAIFERPEMLVLPVATLVLIDLGYVLRMTRASVVEVMKTAYIRTAFLKGLPYWKIVFKHAVPNALMAPITVIMLHVNWLIGGIVVVETVFGFPGLGNYLLSAAMYKDAFAIEAGAMVMVVIAVITQLVADIAYTLLNPRIRYA